MQATLRVFQHVWRATELIGCGPGLVHGAFNGAGTARSRVMSQIRRLTGTSRPRPGSRPLLESTVGLVGLVFHANGRLSAAGRSVNIDPNVGKLIGDEEANKLWTREYRTGWEPEV